tara:strand:+ start:3319 stop:3714 length:396 start_codon:yes stop_codon:yes gene_type:complete
MKKTQLDKLIKEEISKVLKENKFGEKSWDDVDREMEDEYKKEREDVFAFSSTTQGRNAIKVLKNLISKPYSFDELGDVLQILNLNSTKFRQAAEIAGMDLSGGGGSIDIIDDNYQDQDVSIAYINGEWFVG